MKQIPWSSAVGALSLVWVTALASGQTVLPSAGYLLSFNEEFDDDVFTDTWTVGQPGELTDHENIVASGGRLSLITTWRPDVGRWQPGWVFPAPRGGLWQERNFSRAWERLRRRAVENGVRPLPLHATRHTFATWAPEAGTPAKRVAEWIGCSLAVLERHYAHVLPTGDTDLGFLGEIASGAAVGRSGAAVLKDRGK